MSPAEQQLRNNLPDEYKPMLDHYMATKPKIDVTRIPEDRLKVMLRNEYERAERVGKAAERVRAHEPDDPLDPDLAHSRDINGVKVRYEKEPPAPHELTQAAKVQAETGEPVELFGDTVRGDQYPGIDGVIGANRRPLSLKDVNLTAPNADVAGVRNQAVQAANKAKGHGYSDVEVHVSVHGRSRAEVQAAWNQSFGDPFQGGTVRKLVISFDNDAPWVVYPWQTKLGP
jgi:hypothetical protein